MRISQKRIRNIIREAIYDAQMGVGDSFTDAERQEIENILDVLYSLGFKKHCQQFEVCGSYRRGKSESGDVDIVIIPKESFEKWFDNLSLEKRYGHFSIEKLPGFYAFYGFVMFSLIIFLATVLTYLLGRREDFYGT